MVRIAACGDNLASVTMPLAMRGAPRDDNCDCGAYEYNFIFADGFEGK